MNDLSALEKLLLTKTLSMCTVSSYVRGEKHLRDIARLIGIRFQAVQSILTYILGMSQLIRSREC